MDGRRRKRCIAGLRFWIPALLWLPAGLLVPLPLGVRAILVCLPVWLAAWRLARLPRDLEFAPSSRRPGRGRSRGPFSDGR